MKTSIPALVVAFNVAILAGCGGSGSGGGDSTSSGPASDTFVAATVQVAASSPDDAEPSDIEAIPETMPETTEPQEL